MIKNIKCLLLTSIVLGFLQLETSAMEGERGDNKTTPIRQAYSDITRWSEEIDNKINALTKENEILRRKFADLEERLKPLKSISEHYNVGCRTLGFKKKKDLLNNDRTWLLQEICSQPKLIGNTLGSQSWQAAGSKLEAAEECCIKLTTNTSTTHPQLTQDFLTEGERMVRIPFSINVPEKNFRTVIPYKENSQPVCEVG